MTEPDPNLIHARHLLRDSADRLRFQHEFSLAGFKTLVLISGGAMIALLTFIGNSKAAAGQFTWTFGGYALGLALATLAYLYAYESQSEFMLYSEANALHILGLKEAKNAEKHYERGFRWIKVARALCIASLTAFISGSVAAMVALR